MSQQTIEQASSPVTSDPDKRRRWVIPLASLIVIAIVVSFGLLLVTVFSDHSGANEKTLPGIKSNLTVELSGPTKETLPVPSTQDSTSWQPPTPVEPERPEFTLILQPGPETDRDIYIGKMADKPAEVQTNPEPEISAVSWTVSGVSCTIRSLLRFTQLNQIPPTAKIVSAKLYLTGVSASLTSPQGNSYYPDSPYTQPPYTNLYTNTCVINRVLVDWDPTTVTFDNQPNTTSRNEAIVDPSTVRWNYDAVVDVTTMVQEMITTPSKNFGFMLKLQNEAIYRSIIFASSAAELKESRPKLVVVWLGAVQK